MCDAIPRDIARAYRVGCPWLHRAQCALLLLPSLPAVAEHGACPRGSTACALPPEPVLGDAGPEIGSKLRRQVGIEHWGSIGDLRQRTNLEVWDTRCREVGFGFSDADCSYENLICQAGYRFHRRSIGHGVDSASPVYSLGPTLVQSAGNSWNVTVRYREINQSGAPNAKHPVSAIPRGLADIQLSHNRLTPLGPFRVGFGVVDAEAEDPATGDRRWM